MKKLGILLDNFGPSQLAFTIIQSVNAKTSELGIDTIGFFQNQIRPCVYPNFALMQLSECFLHHAPCIATNLNTAVKLLEFPGPTKKFFYIWDLEWLRLQQKQYGDLYKVYGSKELRLICRNEDHRQVVSSCWNANVDLVMESFDLAIVDGWINK